MVGMWEAGSEEGGGVCYQLVAFSSVVLPCWIPNNISYYHFLNGNSMKVIKVIGLKNDQFLDTWDTGLPFYFLRHAPICVQFGTWE